MEGTYRIDDIKWAKIKKHSSVKIVTAVRFTENKVTRWIYGIDSGDRLYLFVREDDVFAILAQRMTDRDDFEQLLESSVRELEGFPLNVKSYEELYDILYEMNEVDEEDPYWGPGIHYAASPLIFLMVRLLYNGESCIAKFRGTTLDKYWDSAVSARWDAPAPQ